MNRIPTSLLVLLVTACGGSTPPAQTAETSAPVTDDGASSLPEAIGKATCENLVVDDLEDGDGRSIVVDERGGYWYTYKDNGVTTVEPQGSFAPASGGANDSKSAANMNGKTADSGIVYAGLGVNLSDPMAPYDLSGTTGFCFNAKGKGSVRVKLPDVHTAPEGKQCTQCYNDFGAEFTLTDSWTEYCFEFAKLAQQPGWGDRKPALTTDRVFSIQWQVSNPGVEFDVWVDDVRLTCGN